MKIWAFSFFLIFYSSGGSNAQSLPVFDDSSSFVVSQFMQMNLGNTKRVSRDYDDGFSEEYHKSFSCSSDAACPHGLPCIYNRCYDLCQEITCPYGQECHRGECIACRYNVGDCCPKGFFSNGRGGCVNPCNPNPCGGTHPACKSEGIDDFTCFCTPSSCPQGSYCSGIVCKPCKNGACSQTQ